MSPVNTGRCRWSAHRQGLEDIGDRHTTGKPLACESHTSGALRMNHPQRPSGIVRKSRTTGPYPAGGHTGRVAFVPPARLSGPARGLPGRAIACILTANFGAV
jgi:hypothetical protein